MWSIHCWFPPNARGPPKPPNSWPWVRWVRLSLSHTSVSWNHLSLLVGFTSTTILLQLRPPPLTNQLHLPLLTPLLTTSANSSTSVKSPNSNNVLPGTFKSTARVAPRLSKPDILYTFVLVSAVHPCKFLSLLL